jgi:hypothetical protein
MPTAEVFQTYTNPSVFWKQFLNYFKSNFHTYMQIRKLKNSPWHGLSKWNVIWLFRVKLLRNFTLSKWNVIWLFRVLVLLQFFLLNCFAISHYLNEMLYDFFGCWYSYSPFSVFLPVVLDQKYLERQESTRYADIAWFNI